MMHAARHWKPASKNRLIWIKPDRGKNILKKLNIERLGQPGFICLWLALAQQEKAETIAASGPVNHFENVSVVRFTGYKPGIE
jgi:hypothetical protein